MDCPGCVVTIFDIPNIAEDIDVLITFLTYHGVFSSNKKCEDCEKLPSVNWSKPCFKCEKLKVDPGSGSFSPPVPSGRFFAAADVVQRFKFIALWLFVPHPKTYFIRKNLGLEAGAVQEWSAACRGVCREALKRRGEVLGGEGAIVEVDEARVGGGGCRVLGAVERGTDRCFFVALAEDDESAVEEALREHVRPGSRLVTDRANGFPRGLRGFSHSFAERWVDDPRTGAHTQGIRRAWREVWAGIPRYGRKKERVDGYLAEFQWKRIYRDPNIRIHHFLIDAAALYPPLNVA